MKTGTPRAPTHKVVTPNRSINNATTTTAHTASTPTFVACPQCGRDVYIAEINRHLDHECEQRHGASSSSTSPAKSVPTDAHRNIALNDGGTPPSSSSSSGRNYGRARVTKRTSATLNSGQKALPFTRTATATTATTTPSSNGMKRARVDVIDIGDNYVGGDANDESTTSSSSMESLTDTFSVDNDSKRVASSTHPSPPSSSLSSSSSSSASSSRSSNGNVSMNAPLAERMRPLLVSDFVGQSAIMGESGLLAPLFEAYRKGGSGGDSGDIKIPSFILWGPPGSGKTTIARLVGQMITNSAFIKISACTANLKVVRDVIERAKQQWMFHRRRTILFVDEIHRFNKLQQDTFLPFIENGTITFIGATTGTERDIAGRLGRFRLHIVSISFPYRKSVI
jgi:hypothetical protein